MNKVKFYLKNGQIIRDHTIISKAKNYLTKAKNNLQILDALDKLVNNEKAKELLKIQKDFDSSEWIVITGYYAMYTSALALVAKIGFRSKNHTATFAILEEYFIKKKILD